MHIIKDRIKILDVFQHLIINHKVESGFSERSPPFLHSVHVLPDHVLHHFRVVTAFVEHITPLSLPSPLAQSSHTLPSPTSIIECNGRFTGDPFQDPLGAVFVLVHVNAPRRTALAAFAERRDTAINDSTFWL